MTDPIPSTTTLDTHAAVRRTQQLSELVDHTIGRMTAANDAAFSIIGNVEQAERLGVDAATFIDMVGREGEFQRRTFEERFRIPRHELGCLMGMNTPRPIDQPRHTKMVKLVQRLLSEAPKMEGAAADDPGAFECQIMLKNGYRAIGSLKKSPDGLLCFLAIGKEQGGSERVIAAEHFFDYEDLECIVIPRGAVDPGGRIQVGRG